MWWCGGGAVCHSVLPLLLPLSCLWTKEEVFSMHSSIKLKRLGFIKLKLEFKVF